MAVHVHTVPLHEGWTVDETIRWEEQGLLFPDVEPPKWMNFVCSGDCAD